jgi:hypothetical protein
MMGCRGLLVLIGGAAVAQSLPARSQTSVPVVGFLGLRNYLPASAPNYEAFRDGLGDLGFIE